MRRSRWALSIVPEGDDQNVYLVLDDLGERLGRVWREADDRAAELEAVILDLLGGQYKSPVRVAFNTAQVWSQDVSCDVAQELRRRCDLQQTDVLPAGFR
jgi:hypothetical protein